MNILVINSGSSSIKYQLFAMPDAVRLAGGLVERIGEAEGLITHRTGEGAAPVQIRGAVPDHRAGLRQVADLLQPGAGDEAARVIDAVGHRVVHGGERFHAPTLIDVAVKQAVQELSPYAPLHNPPNLAGIEVAEQIFPDTPQVAVFDTAFHQTMPAYAYRYAIPDQLYRDHGIRVYGFHGTSHAYVAEETARLLGRPLGSLNLITAHLGNGASITAIRQGQSVDTSMGFTPLPGLVMGTRSGDLDPAVVFYLHSRLGMDLGEIDVLLNKQSGLVGLCGDNDLRDIERRVAAGDADAQLALDVYAYRVRKYIGSYVAALGRVDALVFTAGVGENSATVRRTICSGLEILGIALDDGRNAATVRGAAGLISRDASQLDVCVVPTNEELAIARQTFAVLRV